MSIPIDLPSLDAGEVVRRASVVSAVIRRIGIDMSHGYVLMTRSRTTIDVPIDEFRLALAGRAVTGERDGTVTRYWLDVEGVRVGATEYGVEIAPTIATVVL